MNPDLFTELAKYAHRQEENYLTEAFVYLLKTVLVREPACGISILADMLIFPVEEIQNRSGAINISTQDTYEEGRPDIIIRMGVDCLFFIEVKHDSRIGHHQLESYLDALEKEAPAYKQLILLTRSKHSIQETDLEAGNFQQICWYEISGWLSNLEIEDEIINFLVNEFLDFLRGKEMSMERVSWEYIKGVLALRSLADMVGVAVAEAFPEERTRRTAGWNWIGYYLGEGTDLWVGVRYANHLQLVMENNNGNEPTFKKDLDLSEIHFFSLAAGEQLEEIIRFISASYPEYLSKGLK